MLQCVAVCCSMLQIPRPQVCCSVLQYVAVCCSVLQCVAVCCSVLQMSTEFEKSVSGGGGGKRKLRGSKCVAVRCSALQCVAVCCSVLQCVAVCSKYQQRLRGTKVKRCSMLQPIAGRVAQNLEIISKTLSTYQNSVNEIYDQYHVITWY